MLWALERGALAEVEEMGNRWSREMYDDLPLPWSVSTSASAPPTTAFSREPAHPTDPPTFYRKEWNRDGLCTSLPSPPTPAEKKLDDAVIESLWRDQSLEEIASDLATASMVTRWRERYGAQVEKGEREDCVAEMVGRLREVLGGKGRLRVGTGAVVLLFKRGGEGDSNASL